MINVSYDCIVKRRDSEVQKTYSFQSLKSLDIPCLVYSVIFAQDLSFLRSSMSTELNEQWKVKTGDECNERKDINTNFDRFL